MPRESDLNPRGGDGGRRADSCRLADLMGMMRLPLFMLFMFRGRNGNMGFPVGDVCVRVSLYQIKGGEERALVGQRRNAWCGARCAWGAGWSTLTARIHL